MGLVVISSDFEQWDRHLFTLKYDPGPCSDSMYRKLQKTPPSFDTLKRHPISK